MHFISRLYASSQGATKMTEMMRRIQISANRGAETSVYLASAPDVEGVTGKCFAKMRETRTTQLSYDQEMQDRLWDVTVELLGLTSIH
jgi:hypothetical protein